MGPVWCLYGTNRACIFYPEEGIPYSFPPPSETAQRWLDTSRNASLLPPLLDPTGLIIFSRLPFRACSLEVNLVTCCNCRCSPAAPDTLGELIKMQTSGPYPWPTEWERPRQWGPGVCIFTKPPHPVTTATSDTDVPQSLKTNHQ